MHARSYTEIASLRALLLENENAIARNVDGRTFRRGHPSHRRSPSGDGFLPKHDLAHLGLTTDSTRLVTVLIKLDGFGEPILGITGESHNLPHHVGRELEKVE